MNPLTRKYLENHVLELRGRAKEAEHDAERFRLLRSDVNERAAVQISEECRAVANEIEALIEHAEEIREVV